MDALRKKIGSPHHCQFCSSSPWGVKAAPSAFKSRFRRWEHVLRPGDPDVEGWQQEDADDQRADQAADDDDGERALRVGADVVRGSGGKQAKRSHQHCHHDGAEPQNGPFDGRLLDGVTAGAHLVDVLEHDDAGLHGDAEEREEANAGGNAEVGMGEQQRERGRRREPWTR